RRRTDRHAPRRVAGQGSGKTVAEAARPASPRPGTDNRPYQSDNGLRKAQVRDSAALLHRSAVAAEDRWPLANRAESLHDRNEGIICRRMAITIRSNAAANPAKDFRFARKSASAAFPSH